MYKLLIKGKLLKELRKLNKKNHVLFEAVFKKADEMCINPQHYKNLNYPLNQIAGGHPTLKDGVCFGPPARLFW
ncbi:hypothetical protein DU48_16540 [Methanosarcina mazei]|uniref:Uncharacterized protein n=1 Tax=Methanosarcina mazei TaxID=2209 RepID=A0A0F8LCJ9_METMZ|nr:hypothetical protein DU44_19645 [Methanosarcina mazei]KKH19616.1 hypothetical protein DU48_16540 [Methanosarcina mazei]KKH24699.1 hypothetical protein DU65_07575 [Methanosarcina mazei]